MRYREIIESDAAGIIKPAAPSATPDPEAYQTRQPRPKRRSRWQTPPAPQSSSAAPSLTTERSQNGDAS